MSVLRSTDAMRVYLAGTYSRDYVVKLYLAGEHEVKNGGLAMQHNTAQNILESYYYARAYKWLTQLIPRFRSFMLDSGAFTFMSDPTNTTPWDEYVEQYADFINRHKIDLFFELDIDSAVGLKETERLRAKLEKLTGKQCIPVWHKSRGKDYWLRMASEYDYIAIGGIVSGEIKRSEHKHFPWFIKTARERGAKVHGLGYTNLQGIKRYPFYSVDSTAWLYGNRSGIIFQFNGNTLVKTKAPDGKRLRSREAAIHNFNEWVKFAQYMEMRR